MNRRNRALVALLCLLTVAIIAGEAWANVELSHVQPTHDKPAPYNSADYYNTEFEQESKASDKVWQFTTDADLRAANLTGRWFNYRDGFRVTRFQPEHYQYTVWVFGSSTIAGSYVPDDWTIPSRLQLLFNAKYGDKYRVVNRGVTGYITVHQTIVLKQSDVQIGDIVVFYDGALEARYIYLEADKDRRQLCDNLLRVLPHSALLRLACLLQSAPAVLDDTRYLLSKANAMRDRFRQAVTEAHDYATQHSATFYHFLQPHLWAGDLTEYERSLLGTDLAPNGLDLTYDVVYPMLQSDTRRFAVDGIPSYDLTFVLNAGRTAGKNYFFDFCHVDGRANEVIARTIFDVIATAVR